MFHQGSLSRRSVTVAQLQFRQGQRREDGRCRRPDQDQLQADLCLSWGLLQTDMAPRRILLLGPTRICSRRRATTNENETQPQLPYIYCNSNLPLTLNDMRGVTLVLARPHPVNPHHIIQSATRDLRASLQTLRQAVSSAARPAPPTAVSSPVSLPSRRATI